MNTKKGMNRFAKLFDRGRNVSKSDAKRKLIVCCGEIFFCKDEKVCGDVNLSR